MKSVDFIPDDLLQRYEFHDFGHALDILTSEYAEQWEEIVDCLRRIEINRIDIVSGGGSKSRVVKKFDEIMFDYDWKETKIIADLVVSLYDRNINEFRFNREPTEQKVIKEFLEGHNIDYVKSRVAFDLEWNSKDQTFDRDLSAMRMYYECNVIDVGIIVTRAADLNDKFREFGILAKYGASTTWMGKLLPRLKSRRQGGCPILAIGITKENVVDGGDN